MKKRLLFLWIALAIGTYISSMQSQNWNPPTLEASEIYEGSTYYIQNTGLNLYLAAGGWWDTQAILNSTGLPVTFQADANTELYAIQFSIGNTLFRDDEDGSTYTDKTKDNQWNIRIKDSEKLTYTIQAPSDYAGYNANQYLGSTGSMQETNRGDAYVINYNRDKDTYAKYIEWKFLNVTLYEARTSLYKALNNSTDTPLDVTSYENMYENSNNPEEISAAALELNKLILDYKTDTATPENPVDFTIYITNPGFDNNTADGWKGAGTVNYHEVEFYQKTFHMYQEISGLPAGKYTLKAQGFERPANNDAGAAYKAGTEQIYARFYAKTNSFPERNTPFNSLYQHTYSGSGAVNGYVNTMAGAEIMFTDGGNDYYETELPDILLREGDVLTIGAKSDFQQTGYWALFDNFRLEYLGAFDANDLEAAVNKQITIAQELLGEKMQNSALIQLNSAITQASQAIAAQPLVFEDLLEANRSMNTALENANTSIHAYQKLEEVIVEALEVSKHLSSTKLAILEQLLPLAQALLNNPDATLTEINKAIDDIEEIIIKKIYIPTWMMGNIYDPTNDWTIERSRQSKNWILFWEPGYGEDPGTIADGNYRVDIDGLLELAEICFDFYTDSLKFIKRGSSKTDDYKMIIRLRYTTDWEASGSGVDDTIGLLTLTAWSGQAAGHTMAHEVGHCFQYQVHCDNGDQNGWMYGFGANASGDNGWWEQCAQWQGFKIFPEQQFTDYRFTNYLNTAHKHILHETPRYDNYFIQDYWCYLHGMDFIGRLWNESKRPEDPVETYIRINNITQAQFNDEMYDCAARFATWDIPALKSYGASYIISRPQPAMIDAGNDYWRIAPSVCPENYGYNVIQLNTPAVGSTVSAFFEGKTGMDGYREKYPTLGEWRYGFVAMKADGTRVYSDMGSASYTSLTDTLHFECPETYSRLFLVVTGVPKTYWRHAWDNDDSNDEQWPYQVKFRNTNLSGKTNPTNTEHVSSDDIRIYASGNSLFANQLPAKSTLYVHDITGRCILTEFVTDSSFSTKLPGGIYIVNVQSTAGNYNQKIIIKD